MQFTLLLYLGSLSNSSLVIWRGSIFEKKKRRCLKSNPLFNPSHFSPLPGLCVSAISARPWFPILVKLALISNSSQVGRISLPAILSDPQWIGLLARDGNNSAHREMQETFEKLFPECDLEARLYPLFDNFYFPPKTILSSCLASPSLWRVPEIWDISNMEISHKYLTDQFKMCPSYFSQAHISQIFKVSFTKIDMSESIRKSPIRFRQIWQYPD